MKKKLLFIINTMGRAGAEAALINLLKALDALGTYDLSLYTIIPRGENFDRVPKSVHILNKRFTNRSVLSFSARLAIARSVFLAFFTRLTGFRMIGYFIRNIREQKKNSGRVQYDKLLWRLLAQSRPRQKEAYDLAVAYIEGASAYYLAQSVHARSKAAFVHIDYRQAGYTPLMDRCCYRETDRIFVVSREVGESFCSVYPDYRNKVLPFRNLLDREEIIRKSTSGVGFTDPFDGIRLVTVGRLHYQKGYDIAIEALSRMLSDGYHVRWYILGEGNERTRLEALIEKYGVKESFILMGAKDNPYPYIRQADLYVHATRFEGKSIAIEEAQILGKTIVASDCTGNSEQIESGYDGILLTLNADRLAGELERLIDDPALRKTLAEHVLEKKLDHPEDLRELLKLAD